MLIELDATSDTPIYVQLRNQIVLGIGKGLLAPGENLPTIRQMAEDAGVNMMTVSKAYAILKQEGYIEIDRRHGAKVRHAALFKGDYRDKVEKELELLIAESALNGVKKKTFLALCGDLFDGLSAPAFNRKGGS